MTKPNQMVERSGETFSPRQLASCVDRFRERRPHVHCITNVVAQNFTANVLLAAGATPSMTIARDEIADFVGMADALLINVGTMDGERSQAIGTAVECADQLQKPWALDPVFAQASKGRLALSKSLLASKPSLLRCNAGEAQALFGETISTKNSQETAAKFDGTLALTGVLDVLADANRRVTTSNGHVLMDRVTAMGCALTGLMIGFLAVEEDQLLAAAAAVSFFGLAGEAAAKTASGPGTFVPHFLDALHTLSSDDIEAGVKLA